jgi:hypothetical protein
MPADNKDKPANYNGVAIEYDDDKLVNKYYFAALSKEDFLKYEAALDPSERFAVNDLLDKYPTHLYNPCTGFVVVPKSE